MLNRSEKVAVGQVSPGMDSGSLNSRGIRASSECPILATPLGDQRPGVFVRHDHVGVECAGAEDAHGVVVRQGEIAHRLVRMRTEPGQPLPRGNRRGHRLETDEEVLTLDRADVRVALGGERIDAIRQHLEGLFLLGQVG